MVKRRQARHNGNSNIKTITDASGTSTYNYDSLNRLIQNQKPGGQTINYTYDARGNRLTTQGDTTPVDQNEINYTCNALNQLTSVTKTGENTSYTYDPTGLRLKKTTPTATIKYTYDNIGRIISDINNNNQSSQYIWGPDNLLVKKHNNYQEYYYLYNGHGDVVQIIDSAGNIVNNYEYDEWGNITSQTEGIANDFKYAGEAYDSETGFYYLRARYYDPTVGRFISQDSNEGQITNPLSLNLYTYCVNNPIKYVDPTGNNPVAIAAAYIYITRVATSPDTMRDLQFITMDIAEGNYFAAGLDAIGAAVPGVTGVGKTVTKLYDEARSVTHSLAERTSSYVKGAGTLKSYGGKSESYITKRGWTWSSMQETVKNPYTTREAVNKATGNKATAYYDKAGDYVVVDNITGELVQTSKFGDTGWIPDATIKNPYKP